jgi:hypothetical protein
MEKFWQWVSEFKPDYISKIVLLGLFEKYINGDKEPLFDKMKGLEQCGCYLLCSIFKSLFDFVGIYTEYIEYSKKFTGNKI